MLRFPALVVGAATCCSCLVFSEPINTPPSVTVGDPGAVYRHDTINLIATASDPDQGGTSLEYRWLTQPAPCPAIDSSMPASPAGFAEFTLKPETLGPLCVRVEVSDDHGARAVAQLVLDVKNHAPVAAIGPTESEILLYSDLRLSGGGSVDKDDEQLTYTWNLTGPTGAMTPPICADTPDGRDLCLFLVGPGAYTATLSVVDPNSTSSAEPATVSFRVLDDHAPCILAVDPAITKLPRNPQDATKLSIIDVWDDGDPFPARTGNPSRLQFTWFVQDGNEGWKRIVDYGLGYYDIPAGKYDTGDIVQVRVEVTDRIERNLAGACASDQDACTIAEPYPNATAALPQCLQRMTWTVEYRL